MSNQLHVRPTVPCTTTTALRQALRGDPNMEFVVRLPAIFAGTRHTTRSALDSGYPRLNVRIGRRETAIVEIHPSGSVVVR